MGAIGLAVLATTPHPGVPPKCVTILSPICKAATGIASGIFASGANAIFSALTNWTVNGAIWVLGAIGEVMSATTSIDPEASWFGPHYAAMLAIESVLLLPLILLALIQAISRGNASTMFRVVLVQLPLAVLLGFVAVEFVAIALRVTDSLSTWVASGTATSLRHALRGIAQALAVSANLGPGGPPASIALIGAGLVVMGAFTLWIELLVRSAAVYAATLFLPLALASLVWPTVSHWCRRLVDTLAALILSKFVIVAVLSLAVGALASGTSQGFSSVLAGAAMLILASLTPFTLLKLIPAVEAGAALHLEGARQRAAHTATAPARTAAMAAVQAKRLSAGASSWDPGSPGVVATGGDAPSAASGAASAGGGGISLWPGTPQSPVSKPPSTSEADPGYWRNLDQEPGGESQLAAKPERVRHSYDLVLGRDHIGPRMVPAGADDA